MFEWLFGKKEIEKVEEDTKRGFEFVKKDITSITGWIKHLDSEKKIQQSEIKEIKDILASIQEDVDGIKNIVSIMGNVKPSGIFKQHKQLSNKQMVVQVTQTADQTADQTPNLEQFSLSERAIIWILLNSDQKLSYEDLGAVLGKEKSTLRNQVNTIKQKSEGFIEESVEKNGKKRVFIPEEIKEKLLKKSKVRAERGKKTAKDEYLSGK